MRIKQALTPLFVATLCTITFPLAATAQTDISAHPAVASYVQEQGTLSDVDAIIVFLNRDPLIALDKQQQRTQRAADALLLYLQAVNSEIATLNRYADLLIAASCGGTSYLDRLLLPDVLRWLKPREYFSPQALLRTPEMGSF